MKFKIYLLIPFIITFYSCTKSDEHKTEVKKQTNEATDTEHQHDMSTETKVGLNDGKKWKSDEPTMKRVAEMQKTIEEFDKQKEKDYSLLGVKLQLSIDNLLKECRMKGKEHDALHTWLEPVIVNVDKIKKADKTDAEHIFLNLKEQLHVYDNYFEL